MLLPWRPNYNNHKTLKRSHMAVLISIEFGVLVLYLWCFLSQPDSLTVALETTNIIFVSIFGIEMILKLLGDGVTMYLTNGQNVFDGLIVIVR